MMKLRMLPPMPNKRIQSSKNIIEKQPLQPLQHNEPILENKPVRFSNRYNFDRALSAKSIKSIKSSYSERSISRCSSRTGSREGYRCRNIQIPQKIRLDLPRITSKSWGIFQMKQQKFIYGQKTSKRREMASLTKIMNLVTILEILKTEKLQAEKIKVKVTKQASKMIGTSAEIKQGEIYTLEDLFYGMMLPSGNDAAYLVAQVGGSLKNLIENGLKKTIYYEQVLQKQIGKGRNHVIRYLIEMNKLAKQIGMKQTKWSNPHGLSNRENYTNIQDMSLLCMHAMKNPEFRQVVNTKQYSCSIKYLDDINKQNSFNTYSSKIVGWENTNKMLDQGWSGIKTGITPNAGPCLSASVQKQIEGRKCQFLVLLGNCESMQQRWKQVDQLVNWVLKHKLY